MMMRSALYQPNTLSWIIQCQLIKTTVRGYTCHPNRTHYPDSESTRPCSFSLLLRRMNKYQFHSPWLDPIGARTHDLRHSNPQSTALEPTIYRTRNHDLPHSNPRYTALEPTIYRTRTHDLPHSNPRSTTLKVITLTITLLMLLIKKEVTYLPQIFGYKRSSFVNIISPSVPLRVQNQPWIELYTCSFKPLFCCLYDLKFTLSH